jgi:hypothetical protein
MAEGIDRGAGSRQVLEGGETVEVDGSTVADPETGRPVPVVVLRLPEWRVREVAAALELWGRVQALVGGEGGRLPEEGALARGLVVAGEALGVN